MNFKKSISLLIALIMIITIIPINSFAAEQKIEVSDEVALFQAIEQENTTIVLQKDISVSRMLSITKNGIILDLASHKITSSDTFWYSYPNDRHLLDITNANTVTIKNGSIVTTNVNKHAVNIFGSKNVTLDNLKINHEKSWEGGGAPLVINGSDVTVKENLDLTIGSNSWYGINVDPKGNTASLNFASNSSVSMTGDSSKPVIHPEGNVEDGKITITGADKVGLKTDEKGNLVIAKEESVPQTQETPAVSAETKKQEKDSTPKTGTTDLGIVSIIVSTIVFAGIITIKKYNK